MSHGETAVSVGLISQSFFVQKWTALYGFVMSVITNYPYISYRAIPFKIFVCLSNLFLCLSLTELSISLRTGQNTAVSPGREHGRVQND